MNTTLIDTSGNRMTGAKADADIAQKVIKQQQPYNGELAIAGKQYSVCYTPFVVDNQVVGMFFAGVNIDHILAARNFVAFIVCGVAAALAIIIVLVARWMITRTMVRPINNTMESIDLSAEQVAIGTKQIADNTQILADGVSEQAAAVEQISATITGVTSNMRKDIAQTKSAVGLAETIKSNAENGSRQMEDMMHAVQEIEEASQAIQKVIQIIDDIAFQTNILALNAAVEAAHAGDSGRGFAVVAEEVRSLAAKGQEAARNTSALIENSSDKTALGAQIARETADALIQIIEGVHQSNQVINDIAASSMQQGETIVQISRAIDLVNHVIQQNLSATENTAASSEEMSSLADRLREMIDEFELREKRGNVLHSIERNYAR